MIKRLSLINTLPTENATLRQRTWRTLKASGAAVLRDGVYLMPERESCRATLDGLAAEVRSGGGSAHVLRREEPEGTSFAALFDRRSDFAALLREVDQVQQQLTTDTVQDALRQTRIKWPWPRHKHPNRGAFGQPLCFGSSWVSLALADRPGKFRSCTKSW